MSGHPTSVVSFRILLDGVQFITTLSIKLSIKYNIVPINNFSKCQNGGRGSQMHPRAFLSDENVPPQTHHVITAVHITGVFGPRCTISVFSSNNVL